MTWRITVFVVLWALLSAPAVLLLVAGDDDPIVNPDTRLYLETFGVLAVLSAAWIMLRFVDRRSLRSLGFDMQRLLPDTGIGLILGSAMTLLALLILWLPGWVETVPIRGFSWSVLGLTAAAMLLNSVTQEVMVRGYVLQSIESKFDVTVALVASSLFFLLLHTGAVIEGGLLAAVNLFGAGLLLGLAYTATRNLWLPCGLHFSWNVLQGPILGIAVSGQAVDSGWRMLALGGPALFTGGDFGLEGGLAATLVTAMGISFLVLHGRRRAGATCYFN